MALPPIAPIPAPKIPKSSDVVTDLLTPEPQGPGPVPKLAVPADVAASMKKSGYNPASFEKDLSDLQAQGKGDEALRTYGLIIDRHRRGSSRAFNDLSKASIDASGYQQQRVAAGANSSLSAWDDFGRSFMNGAVVKLGQGVHMLATAIPEALDSDNKDWLRTWQDANAKWYQDNKVWTSPEAEAGMFDGNGDISWKGVAGTMGNTTGMLVGTFLPALGQVGRAGNVVRAASQAGRIGQALTSTAAQSAYVGFMQMLPTYTEEARKAGYSPTQSILAAIPLAAVQGVLEHWGMDKFVKGMGSTAVEGAAAMRLMRAETAKEAFSMLAGKPLTVESFKEITEVLGKNFIDRLRQPETLKGYIAAAKFGAKTESGEELMQGLADGALKKLFDITQGAGGLDQVKDGRGFDPTFKETAIDTATGVFLGGLIGGSMGGAFHRVPSSFQQQTLYGKMDSDIKNLLSKGGSIMGGDPAAVEATKAGLSSYKLLENAKKQGHIDEATYSEARAKLDDMAVVSERLSKSVPNPQARYALYDLNTRQRDFAQQFASEVEAPMQQLDQLTLHDGQGNYRPKPGLLALDLTEANALIAQNLPQRAALGEQIKTKIDSYVTQLVNPDLREEALKKYASDLATDMKAFERGAQARQSQFEERELPDVYATMETPKGRFAVRQTNDVDSPREVVEVKTSVKGARPALSEQRDGVINRFQGFDLPTSGQPSVTFTAVDADTNDQMLTAFDQNPDLVRPYQEWRDELQKGFVDDPLKNLSAAKVAVDNETAKLAGDPTASDWAKGDLDRKRGWVRNAYQQVAENPDETRYGPDDYIVDHHPDFLAANNIDPYELADIPLEYQAAIYDALKKGDETTAGQIARSAIPLTQTINPNDTESGPSALLAAFERETESVKRREIAEKLTEGLSRREEIVTAVGEYVSSGNVDKSVAESLARQLEELSAYSQQLADILDEISSEQPVNQDGDPAGVAEPQAGVGPASVADDTPGADAQRQPDPSAEPVGQPGGAQTNVVAPPKAEPRRKAYDPLARNPESTHEAILHYFVRGGRVHTDDVRRYGDGNWMRGAKGGNPLISYVSADRAVTGNLDDIARSVMIGENEDEQAVMQQIIDTLASFPNLSARQQLMQMQQDAVEQDMGDGVPEFTPMEVLGSLFGAMDRANIPNQEQEDLVKAIEEDYVTADGLDWLGVYNLLGFRGFLKDPQLKTYVLSEYIAQVASHTDLNEQETLDAAQYTPSEVRDILAGFRPSDAIFNQVMEQYALTQEQGQDFDAILGEENPNPIDHDDIPILYPAGETGDTGAVAGSENAKSNGPDSQEQQPAPQASPQEVARAGVPVAELPPPPAPKPKTPAQIVKVGAAVSAATEQVDKAVAHLNRKIKEKQNKAEELKAAMKKRVGTGALDLGQKPKTNYPMARLRPASFTGQAVIDPVSQQVTISADATVTPETTILTTGNNEGFLIETGPRIERMVTYRNYLIERQFVPLNGVTNPKAITKIVTVTPVKFNADGTVPNLGKGTVFYETARETYDQWRAKNNGSTQIDLTGGQVTGLEAENAAKAAIAQVESELAALTAERDGVAETRDKVAEVARQNAENQQDLFAPEPPVENTAGTGSELVQTSQPAGASLEGTLYGSYSKPQPTWVNATGQMYNTYAAANKVMKALEKDDPEGHYSVVEARSQARANQSAQKQFRVDTLSERSPVEQINRPVQVYKEDGSIVTLSMPEFVRSNDERNSVVFKDLPNNKYVSGSTMSLDFYYDEVFHDIHTNKTDNPAVAEAITRLDAEARQASANRMSKSGLMQTMADTRADESAMLGATPPTAELTPDQKRMAELQQKKADLALRLKKSMGSTLNAGINPEIIQIGLEYMALSIEMGVIKFKAFIREFMADTGSTVNEEEFNALKAVYDSMRSQVDDDVFDQMDEPRAVRGMKLAEVLAEQPSQAEDSSASVTHPLVAELGLPDYVNRLFNSASVNTNPSKVGRVVPFEDNDLTQSHYLFQALGDVFGEKTPTDLAKKGSAFVQKEYPSLQKGMITRASSTSIAFANGVSLVMGPISGQSPTGSWGVSIKLPKTNQPNDSNTAANLESNRPPGGATEQMGQNGLQPTNGGGQDSVPGQGGREDAQAGDQSNGRVSLPTDATPITGEPGNQQLSDEDGGVGTSTDFFAGTGRSGGSGANGHAGIQPERSATDAVNESPSASRAAATEDKVAAQAAADSIEVVVADRANIDATLPFLMESQREDVHFAEKRLSKPDGHGVLFTNGTGTGKTFLGLGIIKRMVKQGKKNGVIVVYNASIMAEWLDSAPMLGLRLNQLSSTNDAGTGIVITTFANFGVNEQLANRNLDFVVVDEAQYLMQGADAKVTGGLRALRAHTLHPDNPYDRTDLQNKAMVEEIGKLSDRLRRLNNRTNNLDLMDQQYDELQEEIKILESRLNPLRRKYSAALEATRQHIAENQGLKRPRAVFLSATPFAYQPNIQWAHGYLFEYPTPARTNTFRQPKGYDQFMMTHFGYRWRNNRLETPEAKVDQTLMERNFNTWLRKEGAVSSRMLEIDSDYQRVFALTPNAIGSKIEDGLRFLRDERDGRYKVLHGFVEKKFDYHARQRLLEAIKAQEAIPLIKQWHELGKKVVVFFDFNVGGGFSPFDFSEVDGNVIIEYRDKDGKVTGKALASTLIREFQEAMPEAAKLDMSTLKSPIDQITEAFPQVKIINGATGKTRVQSARDFNDDGKPGSNLLMAQSDACAGWSAHDKTGKHPRVLLNLGMPTAPTKSIQIEGRIYRQGQNPESHSTFVYLNTGTSWERNAFASRIAVRAGTAENLAMGVQARGLKQSFIQAFEASDAFTPSLEEGRGTKALDRSLVQAMSEFDQAKTWYWGQAKKTSSNKATEGKDYFATPEPLGLKLVEWAGIRGGDHVLEPSVGHGAIARWFPDTAKATIIDDSFELLTRAKLHVNARAINDTFENLNPVNKFGGIVMNPPFGVGGKVANEHVLKAATQHLENHGRMVAIVPVGQFNDRFDKWFFGDDEKGRSLHPNLHLSARIQLPSATFERAGTKVNAQILVIDRVDEMANMATMPPTQDFDLTSSIGIDAFFERIENMDINPRPEFAPAEEVVPQAVQEVLDRAGIATGQAQPANAGAGTSTVAVAGSNYKQPIQGKHTRNGKAIFTVQTISRLELGDFRVKATLAKAMGGFHSSYDKEGAIPGFIFKTMAEADAFYNKVASKADAQYEMGGSAPTVPLDQALVQSLSQFAPGVSFGNQNEDGSFSQEAFDVAATRNGLSNTPEAVLNGFRVGSQVYLNPSVLNAQTALHEVGHVWIDAAEQVAPDVAQRGLDLITGTAYEKRFRSNPAYARREGESAMEHNKRIKKEALVEAIADKGAKILSSEKRTGFRKFLSDFWKAIKGALAKVGIHIDTKGGSLADATLEQYTDAVARQMIEGRSNLPRPAGNVVGDVVTTAQQAAESIDAQIVMPTAASRPITNKTASGIASFRDQVESKKAKKAMKAEDVADIVRTLEQLYAPLVDIVIGLAPGSKTTNTLLQPQNSGPFKGNPGTMYDPVSKTFNPELMEEVAKKIKGKKYKYDDLTTSLHKILIGGRATADWFDAVAGDDSYIDDNGEFVKADEYTETNSLTEAFKTIADHKGPWGYLTKLLNSKAAGVLTLPETVADWLDPTGQTGLKDMLVKWRRAHADRAAEIALHRQQQIDPLTEKFKGLSLFDGKNSASNVATKTYPGWANGKAADVTLPVGSWMHMLATHKSQLVSHKGRSSVVADISPLTGNLITLRYGADAEGHSYGWDYADPVTGKTTTYLVEAKTLDTIEADIQATPEHKSAYDDGRNFFKFQKALDYVGGLYRLVNGEEMETYDDYFPTSSVAIEGGDVRTQMPTLIEKTKITQAREGLPMRVRGNDMLAEIQSYARREEHYIANVAVTLNLIRWMKRHSDTMGQLAPKWLKEELKNLQEDLNDPSARAKKQGNVTEVSIGGIDVGFRPMLRRFTTSVFSVSPALPLKQVMTMMQGVGLGIVENRFLAQATLKDLAPLFKEAYHIARQGDENAIYGTKLAEVAFINEMAQYPKLTTVLQRMIGRSEAFIGGSSLDDIKANPYSGTVNAVRKGLHTISDYGLGAVRRSDRAVIISFFKAAQYQVADDIAKGKLTDAAGNAVTDVNSDEAKDRVSELTEALVYDTNQMNSELDRTPLQRDRSLASTLIGLYSGQQQRLLNSFIQRYARWIHAPAGAQKNEAFNQMLWVGFNNIALNAALMALISMMWRMLMKTITGDKRPEEYAQTFAWDTARGILGSFPSIPTEGLVMLTTMTDNQKWSSGLIEYAPGEAVAQVINGMQQSVRYFGEEDEAKKQRLLNQIIYNLADGGTKLTGLPNNIGRIIGKMAKSSPKKQEEFTEAQFEEMIVEEAP